MFVASQMMHVEVPRKIFQSRPDLILNIDNEYMTFLLMDEIRSKCRLTKKAEKLSPPVSFSRLQ